MTTGTANRPRIEPRPEFAKILRDEQSFARPEAGTAASGLNGRFDRLVAQSGTALSPDVVLRLCILSGVTFGGAAFVATENLLSTAVALAFGTLIPLAAVVVVRANRQRKMERQIPAFVAGLASEAREGHGLAHGLELTAADTPAPLGDAIGPAVQRMRMGIGVEAAIEDLPERTGLASMQVLVTALTAHDRTGCDLIALLDRIANRIKTRD